MCLLRLCELHHEPKCLALLNYGNYLCICNICIRLGYIIYQNICLGTCDVHIIYL
jgi:hypothetical protein